jgi:hypothetical protein
VGYAKSSKKSQGIERIAAEFELISTAFHEAGHVICGLLRYMKIPSVAVSRVNGRVEGFTHYELLDQETGDASIQNKLIMSEIYISYAGLLAEKAFFKDSSGSERFPMVLKAGSSPDLWNVAELIKKYDLAPPGPKRQLFKKKVCQDVSQLLEENWDEVKLIAHALYQKKKLDYNDIKNILTRKSKHKDFWRNKFKDINILLDSSKVLDNRELHSILCR